MQASLATIRDELRWALVSEPARLDLVALAIARLDDDPFDDDEVLGALDAWAESVRDASPPDPTRAVETLSDMLGGKLGLRGDEDQYDDPENSFLPRVIERRLGLPILLSVVYIEVARRAAIPLFGLALPGHFVVGHQSAEGPLVVLDPFAGGRALTLDDVELLVARTGASLAPAMLTPASAHTIATRMLRNLVGSYQRRARWDKARAIAQLVQAIDPADDELN
jgi:regulator of sirC expression with transglutaminase-like and TPR domain